MNVWLCGAIFHLPGVKWQNLDHVDSSTSSNDVHTILSGIIQSCCISLPLQALGKMLDARQLGLKMIANVTYGYTAANFSGRMPCVEIADSIVQKGRETLERAIQLVNSTPEWKARVVYGDTDRYWVILGNAMNIIDPSHYSLVNIHCSEECELAIYRWSCVQHLLKLDLWV